MLLVMLGGAVGSYVRFLVSTGIQRIPGATLFPYATLIVNVGGSFLLGVIAMIILERMPAHYVYWYLLLGTGFCGGFTTFSTLEWETYQLVRNGSWGLALTNVVGSVVAGFLGILLAVALVRWLLEPPAP